MNDYLFELKNKMEPLEKLVTSIKSSTKKHEAQLILHQGYFDLISPEEAKQNLDFVNKRLKELSSKLQIELLKLAVVTEVTRFDKSLYLRIIKILDMDDGWWSERKDWEISEWVKELMEADDKIIEIGRTSRFDESHFMEV